MNARRAELEQEYEMLQSHLNSISSALQKAQDSAAKITEIKGRHVQEGLGALHQTAISNTDKILERMESLQDELNKL